MSDNDTFWTVVPEDGQLGEMRKFPEYDGAELYAQRMAQTRPGARIYVLQAEMLCIGTVSVKTHMPGEDAFIGDPDQ